MDARLYVVMELIHPDRRSVESVMSPNTLDHVDMQTQYLPTQSEYEGVTCTVCALMTRSVFQEQFNCISVGVPIKNY